MIEELLSEYAAKLIALSKLRAQSPSQRILEN